MQLELTNEDGGEDQQQQHTVIDNGRGGKGKGPMLKRSESHAMPLPIILVFGHVLTINECSFF
jgi:hypothetical protein